jgi:hypothetical protein
MPLQSVGEFKTFKLIISAPVVTSCVASTRILSQNWITCTVHVLVYTCCFMKAISRGYIILLSSSYQTKVGLQIPGKILIPVFLYFYLWNRKTVLITVFLKQTFSQYILMTISCKDVRGKKRVIPSTIFWNQTFIAIEVVVVEITNTIHWFVPFLYSIYWLPHVSAVACHHQEDS